MTRADMSTAFHTRRVYYGLPACLIGLALVLSAVLGPLSLYRCRMEGAGISVQLHACCARKSKTASIKAERSLCCQQLKGATSQAPALVPTLLPQLEHRWAPVLAVLFLQPELEPPWGVAIPPSERGPPVRPRTPPTFLLNASFLC